MSDRHSCPPPHPPHHHDACVAKKISVITRPLPFLYIVMEISPRAAQKEQHSHSTLDLALQSTFTLPLHFYFYIIIPPLYLTALHCIAYIFWSSEIVTVKSVSEIRYSLLFFFIFLLFEIEYHRHEEKKLLTAAFDCYS